MRIIRPLTITPAMITACNVPETDYTAWSSGTYYVQDNICLYDHKIYKCLVANTNNIPSDYVSTIPPKWSDLGYDNRWRMFDAIVGSKTSQANSITVTIAPGEVIDSIAFLDVSATEISIVMTDPINGVVYSETVNMITKSVVVDAYTYFFEPIITGTAVVLLGIPAYANASIAVTISYPSGTASIGTLALGLQKYIGMTQYNPSVSITDYSKKDVDAFGNYTVIQRAYSKKLSCETVVNNTAIDDLYDTLAGYRTTPVIWVGSDERYSSMIVFGFYKSFVITIPYPSESICSLEIEGLS